MDLAVIGGSYDGGCYGRRVGGGVGGPGSFLLLLGRHRGAWRESPYIGVLHDMREEGMVSDGSAVKSKVGVFHGQTGGQIALSISGVVLRIGV